MDDEAPDAVRITLEHRLDQAAGVGLAAEVRVYGEGLARYRPVEVGVLLVARAVDREVRVEHRETDSARDIELAGQREQGEDGPDRLDAAVGVLEARVHDRAGPRSAADAARQVADGVGRHAGDRLGYVGPEVLHVGSQLIEPVAPLFGEGLVEQLLVDHHLDHAERERSVRPRSDRDPLGAGAGRGLGVARVYHDDVGPPLGGGLQPVHVQWRGVRGGVGAPHDEHLRVLHVREHVDQHPSQRHRGRDHRERDVTERPHTHRIGRAERKQDVRGRGHRNALRLEHVAPRELERAATGVDVHGLGTGFPLDRVQPLDDDVVRLVPADALELVGPLGTHALHWVPETMLGMDDLRRV